MASRGKLKLPPLLLVVDGWVESTSLPLMFNMHVFSLSTGLISNIGLLSLLVAPSIKLLLPSSQSNEKSSASAIVGIRGGDSISGDAISGERGVMGLMFG